MNNFYQILGINKGATLKEIKKSYRKSALKWHPDKNGNSEESKIKFHEIQEAYENLVPKEIFSSSSVKDFSELEKLLRELESEIDEIRDIFGNKLPFLTKINEESERIKERAIKLIESRFSLWGISSQEITLPEFVFLGFYFPNWERLIRNSVEVWELKQNLKMMNDAIDEIGKKKNKRNPSELPWKEPTNRIDWKEKNNQTNSQSQSEENQARDKKHQQNLNNIFEEAKNKSGSNLDEAINNADQEQGNQAYEDNKEKVKEMKQKRAAENPEDYRQAAQNRVKENMSKNEVNEQDLDNKEAWNKLNNSEIKEPSVIVEAEMSIITEIGKIGATKKLNQLITKIQQSLKTGTKEDIEEVKTKLLEFINNPNVNYRFIYNKQETEIKSLLSKLENHSTSQQPTSNNKFPLKVVLPITAALFSIIGLGWFVIHQKRQKNSKRLNRFKFQ